MEQTIFFALLDYTISIILLLVIVGGGFMLVNPWLKRNPHIKSKLSLRANQLVLIFFLFLILGFVGAFLERNTGLHLF